MLLPACQSASDGIEPTRTQAVNPVAAAGLEQAVAIEILELLESDAAIEYQARWTIDQPDEVAELVSALDTELTLGPLARCIEQYRLRFRLADGSVEEFGYFCGDDGAFLRGTQEFWALQQATPPQRFQRLMEEIVSR